MRKKLLMMTVIGMVGLCGGCGFTSEKLPEVQQIQEVTAETERDEEPEDVVEETTEESHDEKIEDNAEEVDVSQQGSEEKELNKEEPEVTESEKTESSDTSKKTDLIVDFTGASHVDITNAKRKATSFGQRNQANDHTAFTINQVITTRSITPALNPSLYYGYDGEEGIFIDARIEVEWSGDENARYGMTIYADAKDKATGEIYSCELIEESQDEQSVSRLGNFEAGKNIVHCVMAVPKKNASYVLTIGTEETVFELDYNYNDLLIQDKLLKFGETATIADKLKLTLISYDGTSNKLEASVPGGSVWEPSKGYQLVYAKMEIENLTSEDIDLSDTLGNLIYFKESSVLSAGYYLESEDGTDVTRKAVLPAKEKRTVYISVSRGGNFTEPSMFYFYLDGKKIYYAMK